LIKNKKVKNFKNYKNGKIAEENANLKNPSVMELLNQELIT
jgi:hypothetical protein